MAIDAFSKFQEEVDEIVVETFIKSNDLVDAEYVCRLTSMEPHVKRTITVKATGEVRELDQWKLGIHFVQFEDEIATHYHRTLYLAHNPTRDNGTEKNPGMFAIHKEFLACEGEFLKTYMLMQNNKNKGLKLYVWKEVYNEDGSPLWEE